jgi:hypothetical protein
LEIFYNLQLLLIWVTYYLRYFLDAIGSFSLLLNSETNNFYLHLIKCLNIQSAENCLGFSETIRQLFGFSIFKLKNLNLKNSISILSNNKEKDVKFFS